MSVGVPRFEQLLDPAVSTSPTRATTVSRRTREGGPAAVRLRYPHPEGLGDPVTFVEEIGHLGEGLVRKTMGGNLARLMNLENVPLAGAH